MRAKQPKQYEENTTSDGLLRVSEVQLGVMYALSVAGTSNAVHKMLTVALDPTCTIPLAVYPS
jgi:hypothetical protein